MLTAQGSGVPSAALLPGQGFLDEALIAGNWGEIGAEKLRL
jgi:hypothetical protein